MNKTIDADETYYVRTTCPQCRQLDVVTLRLDAVLTKTINDAALSVKATAKKVEHDCTQLTILTETINGEEDPEPVDGQLAIGAGGDEPVDAEIVDEETGEVL